MSEEQIGCQDNSCIFRRLSEKGGMRTNGGCRCFERLVCWIQTGPDGNDGHWNREEVRKVQRSTMQLANKLREAQERIKELEQKLESARNNSSFSSEPCSLCIYENGKLIKLCAKDAEYYALVSTLKTI